MVNIDIFGIEPNPMTKEYGCAKQLKEWLTNYFQTEINGRITIIPSALVEPGKEGIRDIDIIMIGELDCFILSNFHTSNTNYPKKDLKIENFCIAMELKSHTSFEVVGDKYIISYPNHTKDATEQNIKQKYAVINHINNRTKTNPYIWNCIWFYGRTNEEAKLGAFFGDGNFEEIIKACLQNGNAFYDKYMKIYRMSSFDKNKGNLFEIAKKSFMSNHKIEPCGLTRRRLETINQKNIINELKEIEYGKKMIVFKGSAGTGKTFRLIQSALILANPESNKRCLILTYNHALVGDIRRLLFFMKIPSGIDGYTIEIDTLHSFFTSLMRRKNININNINNNFGNQYIEGLKCLVNNTNQFDKEWDYILIDEGQDWREEEKEILLKIYSPENLIVADGVNQFIRSDSHLDWGKNIDYIEKPYSIGMRQHFNLARFVNCYAQSLGIDWSITIEKSICSPGGKVFILSEYNYNTHNHLRRYARSNECEDYDILFLVPPTMVDCGGFKYTNEWRKQGIKLFDGTRDDLRCKPLFEPNTCRLYQYDSCRGLESWITICLNFDELIEYKINTALTSSNNLVLATKEEQKLRYAYLWSLMPLTRPIDILVITLKEPNSTIGLKLKALYEAGNDENKYILVDNTIKEKWNINE